MYLGLLFEYEPCMEYIKGMNNSKVHRFVDGCRTKLRPSLIFVFACSFLMSACNSSQPGSTPNDARLIEPQESMSGGGGASGDGGGGQGVLCGSSSNPQISKKLFVRDVYEAKFNQKLDLKTVSPSSSSGISSEALQILTRSLKDYFGPASSSLDVTKDHFWNTFFRRIVFLDDTRTLQPSTDANSPIVLPRECKIVQIAYWEEAAGRSDEGTLYVSQKYWQELDQLNRIALLAHEHFYSEARKAHYKSSDSVRKKIGQLLSVRGLEPMFKFWKPSLMKSVGDVLPEKIEGFKVCEGLTSDDPTARIQLYQYEGTDKKQHFVFPRLSSSFTSIDSLQAQNLAFSKENDVNASVATDLLLIQSYMHGETYIENSDFRVWAERWASGSMLGAGTDELLQTANSAPEFLWKDTLFSSAKPISFSFVNSTIGDSLVRSFAPENPTRDDLILGVSRFAEWLMDNMGIRRKKALKAIAVLNREIKEMIEAGEYNHHFPQWNRAIDVLMAKGGNVPEAGGTDPSELRAMVPVAMFTLHQNVYREKEILALLRMAVSFDPFIEVPLGKLKITQDNNSVVFDLKCKAYADFIDDELSEPSASNPRVFISSKSVELLGEHHDEGHAGFAELLRFNTKDALSYYEGITMRSLNFDVDEEKVWRSHLNRFKSELFTEKSIQISKCDRPLLKDNRDILSQCAVVSLKESRSSYTIYFRFKGGSFMSEDYFPNLEFVQLRPFVWINNKN